jgi:hypothetical protein
VGMVLGSHVGVEVAIIKSGRVPVVHGMVRWRLGPLALGRALGPISKQTLSRDVRAEAGRRQV